MTIGTIKDLSQIDGMPSVWVLRRLIAKHRNFPVEQYGTRGRGYLLDLEKAERFVRDARAGRIMDPSRRAAAIAQFGLVMIEADDV